MLSQHDQVNALKENISSHFPDFDRQQHNTFSVSKDRDTRLARAQERRLETDALKASISKHLSDLNTKESEDIPFEYNVLGVDETARNYARMRRKQKNRPKTTIKSTTIPDSPATEKDRSISSFDTDAVNEAIKSARHRKTMTEKRKIGWTRADEDGDEFADAIDSDEDNAETKRRLSRKYMTNVSRRRRTRSRRSTTAPRRRQYKIRTGPRGGRYYMTRGRKVYV